MIGGVPCYGKDELDAYENQILSGDDAFKPNQSDGIHTNLCGMQFVLIPSGSFIMGSPQSEPGRTIFEVQNHVVIENPFFIQTTEVTQGQWETIMGNNPSFFSDCGPDCPVENVSWRNVQAFINKLNQIDSSNNYRLPTEAEWEYVCRSGSTTMYANGDMPTFECHMDKLLEAVAWYHCNSEGRTHPVAQKAPNQWGVYDMHGNVYEWCQDVYVTHYARILRGNIEYADPGAERAVRSCAFADSAVSCRSAARINLKPKIKTNTVGFRLVREPIFYKIDTTAHDENQEMQKAAGNGPETSGQPVPKPPLEQSNSKRFALQVAATKSVESADRLVKQFNKMGYPAYKIEDEIPEKGIRYRVRIGDFDQIEKIEEIQTQLAEKNINSIVVQE